MVQLQEGAEVYGKSKRHQGKIGVVIRGLRNGLQRSYEVRWSAGNVETVAARSLGVRDRRDAHPSPPTDSHTTPTSFVELMQESAAPMEVDTDSPSSSSDEEARQHEDSVSDAREEVRTDGEVSCHGRVWKPCSTVLIDRAAHVPPHRARLLWPGDTRYLDRTFEDYFFLLYPMQSLRSMLHHTNHALSKRGCAPIRDGDWFRWIGIRLAMAFEPHRGPTKTYWESDSSNDGVATVADYGRRFHMSRHAFENIMYAFAFSDRTQDDPWAPIRPFVQAFNDQRQRVSPPGGKGTELKAIADGDTGILLGLELVEGTTRQRAKPYWSEFGEGTAVVLRLTEPYKGTGRTVVADSAFASVKTLLAVELRGLYFMGIVKTASAGYPKACLLQWAKESAARGEFKVYESKSDSDTSFYALCWADKKPKTIIANRGTTLQGSDSVRPRHRLVVQNGVAQTVRYEKRVPRPQMIELFFSKFSTIDVHDHLRQGSLAIEREWNTHHWEHRVFATILGMVVVDAYLAYRYEATNASNDGLVVDFNTFLAKLAHQLVFNKFVRGRDTRSAMPGEASTDTSSHTLKAFSSLDRYQTAVENGKRVQRQCGECKRKASYYCVFCSDPSRNVYFGVCGPRSKTRDCYGAHVASSGQPRPST